MSEFDRPLQNKIGLSVQSIERHSKCCCKTQIWNLTEISIYPVFWKKILGSTRTYNFVLFDEMCIKKLLVWNILLKKFDGFIAVAPFKRFPPLPTKVLVFMISLIGCLPFAYYAPCGNVTHTKRERASFKKVLAALHDIQVDVIVVSLCCDRETTNIPMFEPMGTCFKPDSIRPITLNPNDGTSIRFDSPISDREKSGNFDSVQSYK